MRELTETQEKEIEIIEKMEHYDMCSLWRFAPYGHRYFDNTYPYYEVFRKRLFEHFGGFTPQLANLLYGDWGGYDDWGKGKRDVHGGEINI